jgi:O-methyltransferase
LLFGRVADVEDDSPEVAEVRELNSSLLRDSRIDLSTLPMADGITLALKREI